MSSIRAVLALSVLTGAGTLSGAALALPVDSRAPAVLQRGIEPVRLVCDAFGRCVRTRPPVVRVLPGIGFGRPVYRGPGYVGPEIGVRGGIGVGRGGDFERRGDRGRMDGGNRGDQGQRRKPDEANGRGKGQMQGDRRDGGGGQGNRRRVPQGGEGDGGGRGGDNQQ